ncbi:Crp/Fnr family transcriptional regulator [Dyadobacter tibetensis]|uniref:Crp/Fnr family transcriptional regulator n=1 Tax=Dyadobacter tibetensis TaxID=1211851 RepID=UPI00046E54B8|nr:Crp/Fnr family transcriptional regulator [Dyadobacter tibetensis]
MAKGEFFVRPGEICQKIGIISQGLMACTYVKDGKEIIEEFAFEGHFISNYYSFLTKLPSEKEIRCLEDCSIYLIDRPGLMSLGAKHSFVESMSSKMNEFLFLRSHDRVRSLLVDSALTRYQKLMVQRPDLVQRIPQYMLASYLNIQPETLSRIRKRIAQKGFID